MPVFFFLSGLLVTQSLDHSTSRWNFLWKRFLRLYPAACFVVLLSACLIGPLVSSLPPGAYFSHPLFPRYLLTASLVRVYYYLPGVFQHSPLGAGVNDSLWSLSLELKLYLFLFLLSFIKNPRLRIFTIGSLALALLSLGLFYGSLEEIGHTTLNSSFVLFPYTQLTVFFLIGTACYFFRSRIIIRNYWLLLALALFLVSIFFQLYYYAAFLLIPILVLYTAVNSTKPASLITPKPDLSYGIYVWGFPIQQLTVNYLHLKSPITTFCLTLLFVIPTALLSWYLIEKPALRLKNRVP